MHLRLSGSLRIIVPHVRGSKRRSCLWGFMRQRRRHPHSRHRRRRGPIKPLPNVRNHLPAHHGLLLLLDNISLHPLPRYRPLNLDLRQILVLLRCKCIPVDGRIKGTGLAYADLGIVAHCKFGRGNLFAALRRRGGLGVRLFRNHHWELERLLLHLERAISVSARE